MMINESMRTSCTSNRAAAPLAVWGALSGYLAIMVPSDMPESALRLAIASTVFLTLFWVGWLVMAVAIKTSSAELRASFWTTWGVWSVALLVSFLLGHSSINHDHVLRNSPTAFMILLLVLYCPLFSTRTHAPNRGGATEKMPPDDVSVARIVVETEDSQGGLAAKQGHGEVLQDVATDNGSLELTENVRGLRDAVVLLAETIRESRAKITEIQKDQSRTAESESVANDYRSCMFANLVADDLAMKRFSQIESKVNQLNTNCKSPLAFYVACVAPVYRQMITHLESLSGFDRRRYFHNLLHLQEHLYNAGFQEWGVEWLDRRYRDYLECYEQHPPRRYIIEGGRPIADAHEATIVGIVLPGIRWRLPETLGRQHIIISYPMPVIA